jgi:hypothetical protein
MKKADREYDALAKLWGLLLFKDIQVSLEGSPSFFILIFYFFLYFFY